MDEATLLAIFNKNKAKPHQHHTGLHGEAKLVRRLGKREMKAIGTPPAPHTTLPSRYKSIEDMPVYRRPQVRHTLPTDWAVIYPSTVLRIARRCKSLGEFKTMVGDYHGVTLTRAMLGEVLREAQAGRPVAYKREQPELR